MHDIRDGQTTRLPEKSPIGVTILDAYAVLALLKAEPGAPMVRDLPNGRVAPD